MLTTETTIVGCTWRGAPPCLEAATWRGTLRHPVMTEEITAFVCDRHAELLRASAGWTLVPLGGQ